MKTRPAVTNNEEDIQSLFYRIVPMLDAIDLKESLPPVTISVLNVADTNDLPLVEISWKLAILLSQEKINKNEHLRIVNFYVTDYFDQKNKADFMQKKKAG